MKKIYFSPEVEVIDIDTVTPLLAGSTEKDDITDGPVIINPDPKTDEELEW